jgi:hypothetical protein
VRPLNFTVMRLSVILSASVLLAACASERPLDAPVTHVSVRSLDSSAWRPLTDEQVATFNELWSARTETPISFMRVEGAILKLSIGTPGRGAIWYYKSSGYATRLTMGVTPVYKLSNVDALNKLLGIAQ